MIFQVKIRSSEELHLPSEQDQHARHRCFTIASDALVTFKDDLNRLSTPAKVKDVVPNLGVEMRALVSRATGKLSGECDVPTDVRNDELKRCGKDVEQCVLQCIHRRREINEQAARREVS